MFMKDYEGGFSNFREITNDEKQMFNEVLKDLVGVGHTPLAVAIQVVSGINYAFLCDAKIMAPGAVPHNDIVIIYKPLQGEPLLTEIRKVDIL